MSGDHYKQKSQPYQQGIIAQPQNYQQTVPKNNQYNPNIVSQLTSSQDNEPEDYENNYRRANVGDENAALREKINILEEKLSQQNEANRNTATQLLKSEQNQVRNKELLQSAGNTHKQKTAQFSELNNRYHEIAQGHNQFLENARNHSYTVQRELEYKDQEISRLKGLLQERSDKLNIVSVTQEKSFEKCLGLDREVGKLVEENQKLREELRQKSHELDMSKLSHKAEGTFLVEVEHLKSDVSRLLQMLRNTSEYKEFADIADDSSHSIRFLKDIKARTYVDNKCSSNCRLIRPCMCPSSGENQWIEDEKLLWVPEEAYKFAHEFRLKYSGELTDTLIEKLLFELNKIWSRREQRQVKRVKGNAAHETAGLRRQLAFNPKYDEHQAKATIQRLQNELKQAYKENREAFAQRERRNPVGTHYVGETLKMTKDVSKNKARNDKQNSILKSKIASMELNKFSDLSEKAVFMEGANWMSTQILSEIDQLQVGVNQQAQQFQAKQEQLFNSNRELSHSFNQVDQSAVIRKCEWFIENIDSEIINFKNKIKSFNHSSEKDMIEASLACKSSTRPQSAILDTF